MKKVMVMMVAATAAFLAGCGGGGGGGGVGGSGEPPNVLVATLTPAPVATPAASAVGACTTDYWGDSISALTAPKLDPKLKATTHTVIGGTAQAALPQFLQAPLAAQFIVIEYGTNEANSQQPLAPALRSMLDRVKALGRTPVLTGLSRATAGDAAYHATFTALVEQLAGEYGAVYANWPAVQFDGPSDLQPDGVHPADAYAQRLADAVSQKLRDMCGK